MTATTTMRTTFPMVFGRPNSNKLGDGASTPLQLIRLQIEQKVNGNFPLIHQIATIMTFKNTHNIILEGAFEFTLPEKATICNYGLDVDGVIVDGVVIEKQAARIIFEREVRKRIDPGFVELVKRNVFRTRIYPIEPQKTRTVRIIYQDQAILNNNGFLYQIPIEFQTQLETLDIHLTCFGTQTTKPNFLTHLNQTVNHFPQFINKENGEYTAEWHSTNVAPSINSDQTLSYILPDSSRPMITAIEKDSNIGAYFAVSCALPKPTEQRTFDRINFLSKTICILWDASLSRSNSKENRLLELNTLKSIFDIWLTNVNQIEIIILIFRNDIDEQIIFQLRSNNWNDFLNIFEDLPYDGATNLSQLSSIKLTQTINYYFLFSDCISTINKDLITENFISNFQAPLWILNGNHLHEPFDFDFIRYLIQYNQHGGGYLNREKLKLNSNDLITIIQTIQIKYINIHSSSTIKQIYPNNSISIPLNSDRFLLVGQIPFPLPNSIQFELEFSMNNQIARLPFSFDIPVNQSDHFGLIRRLWAQEKLNQLNAFKDKNKSDILTLGLEYSLVSQFTSLLVLETLQQHIQYHVCPAESRTFLYKQYMQYKIQENNKKTNNLFELVKMWDQQCQWYDRNITGIDHHQDDFRKQSGGFTFTTPSSSVFNSVSQPVVFGGIASTSNSSSITPIFSFSSSLQQSNTLTNVSNNLSSTTEETPTIILNVSNPQLSYTARISSTNKIINAYSIYLNERTLHRQLPSFYLDVGFYFLSPTLNKFNQKVDKQSIEYGLRILTNILELEFEVPQFYRTVAYKFMELKRWNLALSIFRKIYSLNSDEPQSLRDLAIVLIELDQYDQAVEYFKQILTQTWDTKFNTIQSIVLLDLNRLLHLMNKIPSDIDRRLVRHLPVDIRIIIQWDTSDTIIQLSVKEPTGQICNNLDLSRTNIGGYMTKTYFQANQPIEYLLRKAINGTYLISVTFARNTQHTLTGVTTVLISIYKYFGSNNEEKQIQTVRLTSLNQTIDVSQIEFDDLNFENLKNELQKSKDECHRLQNQLITMKQLQTQSLIEHLNITCDGCFKTPIVGDRYKCLFCPNIDFCQNCQALLNHRHDSTHPLICIRDSSLYASSIFFRNTSDMIHLNTHCMLCSTSPIIGIRHQCITCQIDICEKCEFLCLHDISHPRVKTILPL